MRLYILIGFTLNFALVYVLEFCAVCGASSRLDLSSLKSIMGKNDALNQ